MLSYSIYDECLSWQGGILLNHEIEHNHDVNTMGKFFNYVTTRQYRIRRSTCRTTTAASRAHISILNLGEWKKISQVGGRPFFSEILLGKSKKNWGSDRFPLLPLMRALATSMWRHTLYILYIQLNWSHFDPLLAFWKGGGFSMLSLLISIQGSSSTD